MNLPRLGLAVSGWAAWAATALPSAGAPRVLALTAFLLVCPGLAAVRWVRAPGAARDPFRVTVLESGVLALVLSLTLSVLVAGTLFLAGAFTPDRALLILAALTSALALVPGPGEKGDMRRMPRTAAGNRR